MNDSIAPAVSLRHLARITFFVFLLTFIASRVLVILIMLRRVPDLFLHTGSGTHVHHLNYGIFLLSVVGGLLVFIRNPSDRIRKTCAFLYGFGLALTFDEFGMWLHLGGSYWQRASFDAVIVLLSFLGVIAFVPTWAKMRTQHWATLLVSLFLVAGFCVMLFGTARYVGRRVGPRLLDIEEAGPR